MNTKILKQTFAIALAIMAAMTIGSSRALANCNDTPNAIVGSWVIQLGNGNRILETFTSDRTVVEAGQGDIVAPFKKDFPSFTAGHGAWTCDADGNWVITVVIIMYDVRNPFVYLGQFKSHQQLSLTDANNLTGQDKLQITTPDGTILDGGSTGSFKSGSRIQPEPFN